MVPSVKAFLILLLGLNLTPIIAGAKPSFGAFPSTVTTAKNQTAKLTCVVHNRSGRRVQWFRKKDSQLISVNRNVYSRDGRFQVQHDPGSNKWTLIVKDTKERDSGIYECQVKTSPVITREVSLTVHDMDTVTGVAGDSAKIPCDYKKGHPHLTNFVEIIAWKRVAQGQEQNVYSFHALQRQGLHHAFITKAHFMPMEKPPHLLMKDLSADDEGIYECSVHMTSLPEIKIKTHLLIIVPPEKVEILDSNRTSLGIMTRPYFEFSDVNLTCKVTGGKPVPSIKWFKGSQHLDAKTKSVSDNVVESIMVLKNVSRLDSRSEVSCNAKNHEDLAPKSKNVVLDIHYSPNQVQIIDDPSLVFIEGQETRITCKASGGHPEPEVTWWIGKKPIPVPRRDVVKSNGRTISTLSLISTLRYDGRNLECLATSPTFNHVPLKASKKLRIQYLPKLSLHVDAADGVVDEGGVVFMRCEVDAYPNITGFKWHHKGIPLSDGENDDISVGKLGLWLNPVNYNMSGKYSCVAKNSVGYNSSNAIYLNVRHAPVCAFGNVDIVGVALREMVNVLCRVKASPVATSYRWTFKNIYGLQDVAQGRFTTEDRRSVLQYEPRSNEDFGILECWGSNELGDQKTPCRFKVVEAALPGRPENCTVENVTYAEAFVRCISGHDGGLKQHFMVEVSDLSRNIFLRNESFGKTYFHIRNLTYDSQFLLTMYAVNEKGRSEKVIRTIQTGTDPEGSLTRLAKTYVFPVTAIIGVLIGVVCALVFVSIIIVIIMKLRAASDRKRHHTVLHSPLKQSEAEQDQGKRGGGNYPKKLKHANLYETSAYDPTTSQEDKGTQGSKNDVEYTELQFSGGKGKPKPKKKDKKEKSTKKVKDSQEGTIYSSIDIVKTEKQNLQNTEKQKKRKIEAPTKTQYQRLNDEPKSKVTQINGSPGPSNEIITKAQLVVPPSPPPPLPLTPPPLEASQRSSKSPTNIDHSDNLTKSVSNGEKTQNLSQKSQSPNIGRKNDSREAKDNIPLMDEALESSL